MINSKFVLPEDICLETFDQQISTSNNPHKTIVHENVSLLEPPFISDDPENSRTILTDSPSRFIQDRFTVIFHAIADPENSKTSNDPKNSKTSNDCQNSETSNDCENSETSNDPENSKTQSSQ
jgi:hypothetical protein